MHVLERRVLDGAIEFGYVISLSKLATNTTMGVPGCKRIRDDKNRVLSNKVLRIIHLLYRNRSIEAFRKVVMFKGALRITRYHFSLLECGAFRVYDGYDGERLFGDATVFLAFLKGIEAELLFKL